MPKSVAAVFIAIGTELSSGQVVNTNSAWLAGHLSELGLEPLIHITIPDQHALILDALRQAQQQSDLIFVTGGLGPTSDDFTRDVISQWLEAPLVFNAASWQRLEARAQKVGFVLGSSQKQQCWFPEGAEVIPNPAGTADAFQMDRDGTAIFVLPGPPSEIKALWESGLQAKIRALLPAQPRQKLYAWQCLGVGEGTLGERLETALAGSGLKTGYRAHFPYIEIKVWIPDSVAAAPWLEKVEAALADAIVLPGQQEAAARLMSGLPHDVPIRILDRATEGALAMQLQQGLASLAESGRPQLVLHSSYPTQSFISDTEMRSLLQQEGQDHELLLVIGGLHSQGDWSLGLHWKECSHSACFKLPFKRAQASNQRYVAELAMIYWQEWLYESIH